MLPNKAREAAGAEALGAQKYLQLSSGVCCWALLSGLPQRDEMML